mmetsp:Transcript_16615/g.51980  ORF Transcript_16615/g.51980 Transcript_16615/m.51980 type:complete len:356 (-) Transcript_16615:11-1078(-)
MLLEEEPPHRSQLPVLRALVDAVRRVHLARGDFDGLVAEETGEHVDAVVVYVDHLALAREPHLVQRPRHALVVVALEHPVHVVVEQLPLQHGPHARDEVQLRHRARQLRDLLFWTPPHGDPPLTDVQRPRPPRAPDAAQELLDERPHRLAPPRHRLHHDLAPPLLLRLRGRGRTPGSGRVVAHRVLQLRRERRRRRDAVAQPRRLACLGRGCHVRSVVVSLCAARRRRPEAAGGRTQLASQARLRLLIEPKHPEPTPRRLRLERIVVRPRRPLSPLDAALPRLRLQLLPLLLVQLAPAIEPPLQRLDALVDRPRGRRRGGEAKEEARERHREAVAARGPSSPRFSLRIGAGTEFH